MIGVRACRPAVRDFCLPPTPLAGEQYDGGHAWFSVGYDRVGGSTNSKCQGRIIALKWWHPGFGRISSPALGTAWNPFALLLTQSFKAYALRIEWLR